MKTSCGLLLTDGHKILLAHVTNKPQWDIIKGVQEEGETPLACMLREAREESGIVFDEEEQKQLVDLGLYEYLPAKKLHLFLFETSTENLPDVSLMACDSMFIMYGKEYPEVDSFEYVPFDQLVNYTSIKLFPVLEKSILTHYKKA